MTFWQLTGPSCAKVSHLPNFKVILVRFVKNEEEDSEVEYCEDSKKLEYVKDSKRFKLCNPSQSFSPNSAPEKSILSSTYMRVRLQRKLFQKAYLFQQC